MKQKIIVAGVVFALAVAGVFVFVFSSLDSLIKDAVEKYGSEVTKAEVRLDKVKLDISSGKGGLKGLRIGNPRGFETPSAFKLGEISVDIDTATVTGNPVIINKVVIAAPEVTYELGSGGSNIDAIQKNVNAYMARFGGGKEGSPGKKNDGKSASGKKDDGGGTKLIIRHLYVRGGTVNVSATILKGKTMSARLPDIHLKDIGKKKGGATPAEVAEKLLTSLNKNVSAAVSGIGVGKTLDSLRKNLSGVTKGIGEAAGSVGNSVSKSVGNSVNKGAAAVGSKIKGLLGK